MAHSGKYYPINQALRFHAFNEQWPFFPPKKVNATIQNWSHAVGVTPPAQPYAAQLELFAGGIGFDWYEYRSPVDMVAGHSVEIGFERYLLPNHWQAQFTPQVWFDGLAQHQRYTTGNYVPVWMFEASAAPPHNPTASLWFGPIGPLFEAVLW